MIAEDRLRKILETMDVPAGRLSDPAWMLRNLRVRNGTHPDVEEALRLLRDKARKDSRNG